MILKHVEAENILKYRRLRLVDLPAQGQIAVAGRNEAGKTAVGETICFGLFGRTFSLGADELHRVIRWGEYHGSVRVVFSVGDGEEYTVVREIDNTGKHQARLYHADSASPVAQGIEAVARAVHDLGGFTYRSFVDSFYLAQREMEVPHAKSATVKALIGVDKLEGAAAELQGKSAEIGKAIRALEAKIADYHQTIAQLNLDRAQLGRLESQHDAKARAADDAQAESGALATRAQSIRKAATAFVEAGEMFARTTLRTNYGQWRDRKNCVSTSLVAAAKASKVSGVDGRNGALHSTGTAIKSFENGLAEYDKVRNLANLYRQRLVCLLDDVPSRPAPSGNTRPAVRESQPRFADRRATALKQVERASGRRRLLLVLGVFAVELALLAWTGWVVLYAAPESTVGGWFRNAIALSESGRQLLLLFGAIGASALTGMSASRYLQATKELHASRRKVEDIDSEAQVARAEIGVIDEIDDTPLPDALDALGCVRNDLVTSAVVLFSEGDGAVLVRQDALDEKLEQIRSGSASAARSIQLARTRIADRAANLKKQSRDLRDEVSQMEEQIATERKKWEQLEALERTIAGLDVRANELRHEIVTRTLACELIDGACRQIYARFHPELRRFVSRILPRLTEDRYEHLELDDDLRVRVFCKEKNDFVGLAEISNGTHRQLMLCVRLALSQALIASSSKAAQFIFFDEPFAFFDEQRMAKAIDVLRKISPQITQVWLAAQKFDNPATFDLFLDCGVDQDCLEASGPRRRPRTAHASRSR